MSGQQLRLPARIGGDAGLEQIVRRVLPMITPMIGDIADAAGIESAVISGEDAASSLL